MTTCDLQLGAVHVLGLGIIHFYSDSQQNEPATAWKMYYKRKCIIYIIVSIYVSISPFLEQKTQDLHYLTS